LNLIFPIIIERDTESETESVQSGGGKNNLMNGNITLNLKFECK